MAINVSEARVKQITAAVDKLTTAFSPWDETNKPEDFLAFLSEDIEWYDHGFKAVRRGHEAILGLHKAFLHCNQPFKAINQDVQITPDGAAFQQLWVGRCTNGIIRPNGDVVMPASGKDFKSHVAFFIKVSEGGKITRIDEYDYRDWDHGVPKEEYVAIGAVSSKIA